MKTRKNKERKRMFRTKNKHGKKRTITKTKKYGGTKNSTKKTRFEKASCAPSTTKHKKFSCYSDEALQKLKKLWNARHPDELIKATESKKIWEALKNYMQDTCSKETCWLKQKFAEGALQEDKDLANYTFAPRSPVSWSKNPTEWLSSLEISRVMKQYEHTYKCFEFIGPSPIDFDEHYIDGACVWEELCHFNVAKQVAHGKTKIGIILNTDPHTKGGSHWISLFINLKRKFIFYFDSNGDRAPAEVKVLSDRIIKQAQELPVPIKLTFYENAPLEHQFGNTECGMYSLYLIICLVEENKRRKHWAYTDFMNMKKRIQDKDMEHLRPILFNIPKTMDE
jgi:hypothetical protein